MSCASCNRHANGELMKRRRERPQSTVDVVVHAHCPPSLEERWWTSVCSVSCYTVRALLRFLLSSFSAHFFGRLISPGPVGSRLRAQSVRAPRATSDGPYQPENVVTEHGEHSKEKPKAVFPFPPAVRQTIDFLYAIASRVRSADGLFDSLVVFDILIEFIGTARPAPQSGFSEVGIALAWPRTTRYARMGGVGANSFLHQLSTVVGVWRSKDARPAPESGIGAVGSALAWGARGHRFESGIPDSGAGRPRVRVPVPRPRWMKCKLVR